MNLFSHFYLFQNDIVDLLTPKGSHVIAKKFNVILSKMLNLGFRNVKSTFFWLHFLLFPIFFYRLLLFIWVDICILRTFHEILTCILTREDKSVIVLGICLYNLLLETLKTESSFQTFTRLLKDCFEPKRKYKVSSCLDN